MEKTTVVHCKKEPYDIYIGRPSKWGNPFVIGKDGTREEVVVKFNNYIRGRSELYNEARLLRGLRLGCWCAPFSCHGDILKQIADSS